MVKPDYAKWNQTIDDLRRLATEAPHLRTRERFMALFMIASGKANATTWAAQIGVHDETVMRWVHHYNRSGPDALTYRRTGGRRRFFTPEQTAKTIDTAENTVPLDHGLPGHAWTTKKLRLWILQQFPIAPSRSTLRRLLKQAGLSWKKCKKLLAKADPVKRQEFMTQFRELYVQMLKDEVVVIYVDESHIHRDVRIGYGWSRVGKRDWVFSDSPGLSEKVNWFGAYNLSTAKCMIWSGGKCDGDQTVEFLVKLASWAEAQVKKVVVIWDGAPWHRSKKVRAHAEELGLTLFALPAYSPDLNPVERLWKWLREEVTWHHCYKNLEELKQACFKFVEAINNELGAIPKRLWPRLLFDAEHERLLGQAKAA